MHILMSRERVGLAEEVRERGKDDNVEREATYLGLLP